MDHWGWMERMSIYTFKNKAQVPSLRSHYLIPILRPIEPVLLKPFFAKGKNPFRSQYKL